MSVAGSAEVPSSGRSDLLGESRVVSAADESFVTRAVGRVGESVDPHGADAVTQRSLDRRRRQPVVDRAVGGRQIITDHLDVVGKLAAHPTGRADLDAARVHEREVMECEHGIAGEVRAGADGQHGLVERCAFVVDEIGKTVDTPRHVIEPASRRELPDFDKRHACFLRDVGRDIPAVRRFPQPSPIRRRQLTYVKSVPFSVRSCQTRMQPTGDREKRVTKWLPFGPEVCNPGRIERLDA